MVDIERTISKADAIADCIPLVSTVTNGAQLIYQLACRVNAAANPVNPSWKDEVHFYVVSKSRLSCVTAMIPLYGNIVSLIGLFLTKNRVEFQLFHALEQSNIGAVKFYLNKYPHLNENRLAEFFLRKAACHASPEIFKLILASREWDHDAIFRTFPFMDPFLSLKEKEMKHREENTKLLLDYYRTHFAGLEIENPRGIKYVTFLADGFVFEGRTKIAYEILDTFPQCDLKILERPKRVNLKTTTVEKVIKIFDAVCDCIPIVSTVTNCAQLLYNAVRKVDTTTKPVRSSWKNDLKVHIIAKTKFECIIGSIPVLGNFMRLIYFTALGFTHPLREAIQTGNIEAVKLHLANHPLKEDREAKRVLARAAFNAKPEIFDLILTSREWTMDAILKALRCCQSSVHYKWNSAKRTVNALLDYYSTHFPDCDVKGFHVLGIKRLLEVVEETGDVETAHKIMRTFPQCL